MVDVGVGQNNRVEIGDRERESPVFFGGFLAFSLKHPAVESDRVTVYMEEVARARDFPGGAYEGYLQTVSLLLPRLAGTGS